MHFTHMPTHLAEAASANLVMHMGWIQQHTPGMYLNDDTSLVLADSGLDCDTFNVICRARLDRDTASARIQESVDWFVRAARPFSWWLSPGDQPSDLGELLLQAGLQPTEVSLAMAADLTKLPAEPMLADGFQVRRVQTADQLRDFAHVVSANWTPPDPLVVRFYNQAAPGLRGGNAPLRMYVGYLEDQPVAASEVTLGGGVAGLYSVCTLAAFRRRGFGAALTLQPLLDARVQGYGTAILQASAEGARVYARIGFEPFGEVVEYKLPLLTV